MLQSVCQPGRAGVLAAVGADEGVMVDDDPVVGRISVHHGSVPAVAAEEGVLPAGGGVWLPRAVAARGAGLRTCGGHRVAPRSTATP